MLEEFCIADFGVSLPFRSCAIIADAARGGGVAGGFCGFVRCGGSSGVGFPFLTCGF